MPREVKLAKYEYGDRIRVKDDGSVVVLQPGSDIAYEAADPIAAVRLLAAEIRKSAPPEAIGVNAESGGGVTNGGTYGGGTGQPAADRLNEARAAVSGAF